MSTQQDSELKLIQLSVQEAKEVLKTRKEILKEHKRARRRLHRAENGSFWTRFRKHYLASMRAAYLKIAERYQNKVTELDRKLCESTKGEEIEKTISLMEEIVEREASLPEEKRNEDRLREVLFGLEMWKDDLGLDGVELAARTMSLLGEVGPEKVIPIVSHPQAVPSLSGSKGRSWSR
jgi:hypothetical protein